MCRWIKSKRFCFLSGPSESEEFLMPPRQGNRWGAANILKLCVTYLNYLIAKLRGEDEEVVREQLIKNAEMLYKL